MKAWRALLPLLLLAACPVAPPRLTDDGEPAPVDAGDPPPPPAEDAGDPPPPPVEDAGPDVPPPVEDAGDPPPPPVDAGPDVPPPVEDPCEAWAVDAAAQRARLELSSVSARAIPEGYLLQLHVDTSALGPDLELVYCDDQGAVSARPYAVRAGSAAGAADTVLITRAAAPIAPGAVDRGYFLYAAPSTTGADDVPASRVRSLFIESNADGDNPLTLPATSGPERWLVLMSWQQYDRDGNILGDEADCGHVSVRVDGAVVDNMERIAHRQEPNRMRSHGAWLVLDPSGASREVSVRVDNDGLAPDDDEMNELNIVALLLPEGTEVLESTRTNVEPADGRVQTLNLPAASGAWLWMSTAVFRANGSSLTAEIGNVIRQRVRDSEPGNSGRSAMAHLEIVPATAAQSLRLNAANLDGTVASARMLAVSLALFDSPVATADTGLRDYDDSGGFQTHDSVVVNASAQPREHLLFSAAQIGHGAGGSERQRVGVRLVEGQAEDFAIDDVATDRGDADRSHLWVHARATSAALTLEQIATGDGSAAAEVGRSSLGALRYLDVETATGPVEGQPDAGP